MAPSVEFKTGEASPKSYTDFINNIRATVPSNGSPSHGIQVLPKESSLNQQNEFVLVMLTNDESQFSITVAVSAVTLNVVAYAYDESTGTGTSFFLNDAPKYAASALFTDTRKSKLHTVSSGYSGVNRSDLALGIEQLKLAIIVLHEFNDPSKVTPEFRSRLAVVQEMVSEAARFYYIQKHIADNLLDHYKPMYDAISYEDNWSALSQQIQLADPSGKFAKPVTLLYANNIPKIVTNVAEVKGDISLLLCYPNN